MIQTLGWYAPSLTSDQEAGLGSWEVPHIAQLLQSGVSQRGPCSGRWPKWCSKACSI
ncbi:hypothetical protein LP420_04670 [Massilia sp. B-10]|nr:hypothetical protein LP420_04670 [Massilia sp. B-10]